MGKKPNYATEEEVMKEFNAVIGDIVKEELDKLDKMEDPPIVKELKAAKTLEERIKINQKYGYGFFMD